MTDPQTLPWWRHRGVWAGFCGSLLISIAVLTPGFVSNDILDRVTVLRWIRRVLAWQVGRVFMLIGLVLLFRAWLLLRSAANPHARYGAVLALWSLPMLAAPPIFSSDVFLYADQGWIIHQGLHPYEVGLTEAGGPFAENVHQVWRGTTAVYPPLALVVQYVVAVATGFHPYWTVVAMRIPAIAAVAVIAWAVPRLARDFGADPRTASWFAVLNPLLIIHVVGGAHNDAWMIALVVLAVLVARRWGWAGMVLGAVFVGLGAAFKQPGIIATIAIGLIPVASRLGAMTLRRRLLTMAGACLASTAITIGSFLAVSAATFGLGWRHATDIAELTWGMSPASVIEQVIGPLLSVIHPVHLLPILAKICTGIAVVAIAYIAWYYFFSDHLWPRRLRPPSRHAAANDADFGDHPVRWLGWAFVAVAFSGAGFHTWYLLWGGVFLGLLHYRDRVLRWMVAGAIACVVVQGGLEYYALRPIPGWLLGVALGWIFLARTRYLRIAPRGEPAAAIPTQEPA